jgi:hypothetical protein
MKKLIKFILVIAGLSLSVFALIKVQQAQHSWLLLVYLALFVFLPLLTVIANSGNGLEGYKQGVRTCASALVGLAIASLVYKFLTPKWGWACLAGAALPAVFMIMVQWRTMNATMMSNQAAELLKKNHYNDALKLSNSAREIHQKRGNRDGQALNSYYMGLAYNGLGDGIRAARYLNNSLALYQALGNAKMTATVSGSLRDLSGKGVDISVTSDEDDIKPKFLDFGFLFSSLLVSGSLFALAFMWGEGDWRTYWLVLVSYAGLLFFFLVGKYFVDVRMMQQSRQRRSGKRSWAFHLLFLIFLPVFTGWMLAGGFFAPGDFPTALRAVFTGFSDLISSWPQNLWLWLGILNLLALLIVVFPISGLQNLVGGLGQGNVIEAQAISAARRYIEDKDWGRAITQLNRVDLLADRDPASKANLLFTLAFTYHMNNHHVEAMQYLQELFEVDANHQPGLYLAGYATLNKDELDNAEAYWRRLIRINPGYCPAKTNAGSGDAQYHLGLTLYRKALASMEKDPDRSAMLLSEVGQLGSLDKDINVAKALVRVHLDRCAQFIRVRQWNEANQELALANRKCRNLGSLDKDELAKLQGLCHAAEGLINFRLEKYKEAELQFQAAHASIEALLMDKPTLSGGQSFFEELLKAALAQASGAGKVQPAFPRDLFFLSGLVYLRTFQEADGSIASKDFNSKVALMEKYFEKSISAMPNFMEGRAMLGLIQYYFEEDPEKQAKGIEILQSIKERVGSRFVIQTIDRFEGDKKNRADAQQAYFDLMQQYLQFSNVPLQQRQALRDRALKQMKQSGQAEGFIGSGGLEIDTEREHEPSVQEYMMRSALLREKINQLVELDNQDKLPPEEKKKIKELIDSLNKQNQELQDSVAQITEIEGKLLQAAQKYI